MTGLGPVPATGTEAARAAVEQDSPEALAWQAERDAEARDFVQSWPGHAQVVEAYARWDVETAGVPVVAGEHVFSLDRRHGSSALVATRRRDGKRSTLLESGGKTVDWWYPSPAGTYVAVGLSADGGEQSTLRIVDVAAAALLDDVIPHASAAHVAWLPDETGFYVNAGRAPDQVDSRKWIVFHTVGSVEPPAQEPIPALLPIHAIPTISRDGRWVALLTYPAAYTFRLWWVLDRAEGTWREAVPVGDQQCSGVVVGNRYLAVTTEGAPRGRLVAVPLTGGGRADDWEVLRPECDEVLVDVRLVGSNLVLLSLDGSQARVRLLADDGSDLVEVALPPHSTVAGVWDDDGALGLQLTSFTRSPASYRYDTAAARLELTQASSRVVPDVSVVRITATSADGTPVPAFVVRRVDQPPGPQATVIHAYGGFNHRWLPTYDARWAAWLELGGTYVLANLRGGGELGRDWWHGGRMAAKQNTYDDLYAVAERVVELGLTDSSRLGMIGASNGGLLAGAAIVQRPELFAAVVPVVPILDLLRVVRDPFPLSAVRLDYGDPEDPHQAEWLRRHSPCHLVRPDVDYPAVLVMCGAVDVRCPAWHSRTFVASLRAATCGSAPLLLRAPEGVGHGTGLHGEAATAWACDPLAFLCRVLEPGQFVATASGDDRRRPAERPDR